MDYRKLFIIVLCIVIYIVSIFISISHPALVLTTITSAIFYEIVCVLFYINLPKHNNNTKWQKNIK